MSHPSGADNPSVTPSACHLPVHRGGFGVRFLFCLALFPNKNRPSRSAFPFRGFGAAGSAKERAFYSLTAAFFRRSSLGISSMTE